MSPGVKHLLTQTSGFSSADGHGEFTASDTSEQAIENSVRGLTRADWDSKIAL